MTNRIPAGQDSPRRPEPGILGDHIRRDAGLRRMIAEADIVIGSHPEDPDRKALFFGRRLITGQKAAPPRALEVDVNFDSNDLEALFVACVVLKGSCCYEDPADLPEAINPAFN